MSNDQKDRIVQVELKVGDRVEALICQSDEPITGKITRPCEYHERYFIVRDDTGREVCANPIRKVHTRGVDGPAL